MSFTYGFFDSVDHDRTYSAEQFSSIFSGIITDGVLKTVPIDGDIYNNDCFALMPAGAMNIYVGRGRAWFNNTWSQNGTRMAIALDASHGVLNRYDTIVLEVNTRTESRTNSIKVLKGTPATNAIKPLPTNEDGLYQHVLGYVYIPARASVIKASNIENVVGTSETPYCRCIASDAELHVKNDLTTTVPGYVLDARQGKVLNDKITNQTGNINTISASLNTNNKFIHDNLIAVASGVEIPFKFGIVGGKYGYYKKTGGADTFFPFKKELIIHRISVGSFDVSDPSPIIINIKASHPDAYNKVTVDNFFIDYQDYTYMGGVWDNGTGYPQGVDVWSDVSFSTGFSGPPITQSYSPTTGLLTIFRPSAEKMAQFMSFHIYNGSSTTVDETFTKDIKTVPIILRGECTVYMVYADWVY